LNKDDLTKTTLPIGWRLFTLLAVETDHLSSRLPTQTHQMRYPLQERHFAAPLRHAEKQQLHWNWEKLSKLFTSTEVQSSSLQPPKR